jgi:hypothetical protein
LEKKYENGWANALSIMHSFYVLYAKQMHKSTTLLIILQIHISLLAIDSTALVNVYKHAGPSIKQKDVFWVKCLICSTFQFQHVLLNFVMEKQ